MNFVLIIAGIFTLGYSLGFGTFVFLNNYLYDLNKKREEELRNEFKRYYFDKTKLESKEVESE